MGGVKQGVVDGEGTGDGLGRRDWSLKLAKEPIDWGEESWTTWVVDVLFPTFKVNTLGDEVLQDEVAVAGAVWVVVWKRWWIVNSITQSYSTQLLVEIHMWCSKIDSPINYSQLAAVSVVSNERWTRLITRLGVVCLKGDFVLRCRYFERGDLWGDCLRLWMYSMTFGLRCMARGGGLLTGVSWHEDCQGKVSIIMQYIMGKKECVCVI